MFLIEQAIFAPSPDGGGCQLAAASGGLGSDDRRELAAWGPSHDGLWKPDAGRKSINFHPLSSGNFCVSRSTPAGWDGGGPGGPGVATHCLIVPAAGLRQFANNPLALAEEAAAAGAFDTHRQRPGGLQPLQLSGGAAAVDLLLLERVGDQLGAERLAALVQAALQSVCLAVGGGLPVHQLLAAVLNCLPVECRTEFSFSTELKFSSRRPLRIIALPCDPAARNWLAHHPGVTLLDLEQTPPGSTGAGRLGPADRAGRRPQRLCLPGGPALAAAWGAGAGRPARSGLAVVRRARPLAARGRPGGRRRFCAGRRCQRPAGARRASSFPEECGGRDRAALRRRAVPRSPCRRAGSVGEAGGPGRRRL